MDFSRLKRVQGMCRCLSLLLVTASLLSTGSRPAQARAALTNQVSKDGNEVTIAVPIEFHIDPARRFKVLPSGEVIDGSGLAARWETGAEGIWNQGLANFLFRGCYTFEIDVEPTVNNEPMAVDTDRHQVWIKDKGHRSQVNRGGGVHKNKDDNNTYTHPGLGFWSGTASAGTIAHEVGHLLGLADDYVDVVDSNGKVTGAQSLPGRQGTLMGVHQQGSPATWIDQQLVDRLGAMASVETEMLPCFQGSVRIIQQETLDDRERTATLDVALAMQPNEAGELVGLATGSFSLEGTVQQGECSFTYGTSTDVSLDLKATGGGDGPFTLESQQTQRLEEVQRHFLCQQAIDLLLEWDIGLRLENVRFVDGRYDERSPEREVVLWYFGRD